MSCYPDKPLISPEAFREIIRGRKIEKKKRAEEKRREGLRQIAERVKYKSEINTTDSFQKEDLGESESNRVRDILFPQALKLVLDRVKNHDYIYTFFFDKNDIAGSELSPFMKLREVSKSLRDAVDSWFGEKIEEQLHQRSYKPSTWNPVPPMIFYLCSDMERINGLIENYGMATATTTTLEDEDSDDEGWGEDEPVRSDKAFFIRSIEVVMLTPVDFPFDNKRKPVLKDLYQPFINALFKLLELVGDQILSFRLKVNPVDYFSKHGVTFAHHYLMLHNCCELMPNLRRLDVYFMSEDFVKVTKVPKNFAEAIDLYPFPTLSKLERVSLEQDEDIHITPKIYDAILRANPHVTMVKFMMEDKILKKVSPDYLKNLKLEYFSWDNTSFPGSPRSTSNDLLHSRNWPLKSAKIQMGSQSLRHVFQTLNGFPTLEMLALSLARVEIGRENEFLMLPNLTHFNCKFEGKVDCKKDDANFFFSLQFLIHAKKLKRLRWTSLNMDDARLKYLETHECPDKMLDFRGGRKDLDNTNIYDVFPYLERVEVEGDTIVNIHRRPGKIGSCDRCHGTIDYDW